MIFSAWHLWGAKKGNSAINQQYIKISIVYNLHFICTQHRETGVCNSTELHRIIDGISPEIIFEELPIAIYETIYKEQIRTTLESDAIKLYLQNKSIDHIPVDTFERPKHHDENVARLLRDLTESAKRESFNLRRIIDQFDAIVAQKGFSYLNNESNDKAHEILEIQKQKALAILNNEWLNEIANADKEIIENRENVILDNVYRYSKDNEYETGILFIGAGHRKSMFRKIADRKKLKKTKINWILYGA